MPQILSNKSSLAYAYFANKWPLSLQLYQKTSLQLTNVKSQEQKQFWVKIWSSGSGVGERRLSGKLSTQLSESTRTLFWLDHNNRKLFGCIDECFGVSTLSVWLLEILVGFSQFLSFIWSLTQPGDGMVSCIWETFGRDRFHDCCWRKFKANKCWHENVRRGKPFPNNCICSWTVYIKRILSKVI